MTGVKEQMKGKITHNPDLVQQGVDRKTGALKKKDLEEVRCELLSHATRT